MLFSTAEPLILIFIMLVSLASRHAPGSTGQGSLNLLNLTFPLHGLAADHPNPFLITHGLPLGSPLHALVDPQSRKQFQML
jgi:hypothetical protein